MLSDETLRQLIRDRSSERERHAEAERLGLQTRAGRARPSVRPALAAVLGHVLAARRLADDGLYVATDRLYDFPLVFLTKLGRKRVVFTGERPAKKHVLLLMELIEAGKYRAVVDRTYPLEDVLEATRYVESWQKTGNVVLTVSHDEQEATR